LYKLKKIKMSINLIQKILNPDNSLAGKAGSVFVIAEAGVNHNGDIELAKKMIDAAAEAGVDAVKFQTFKTDLLVSPDVRQCDYQKRNTGMEESQYNMLRRLELPREGHHTLKDYCESKGLMFISSPFTEDDVDFLDELGILVYKIPSGELNNLPFLRRVAKKGRPMIVSTGMATLSEVKKAKQVMNDAGNDDIIFLHCTSNYPAAPESLNLRVLNTMRQELGAPIGYSDHSEGYVASIMAVALGACVIERHFTLDKNMEGPDHRASLEPSELAEMLRLVRIAEVMLGRGEKKCTDEEEAVRKLVRKSIFAKQDIPRGWVIRKEYLEAKRPGDGIPPSEFNNIVGKVAKNDIMANALIKRDDYEKE